MIGEAPKNSPWEMGGDVASVQFLRRSVWAEDCYFPSGRRPNWYVDAHSMVIPIPVTPSTAAVWGPVWHKDPNTGVAWLFYAASTSCRKSAGLRKVKYTARRDIQVIKSLDGIQWSAPKTILTQAAESNHLPKLVANQLAVHEPTGHWVLPMWRETPHSTNVKLSVSKGTNVCGSFTLKRSRQILVSRWFVQGERSTLAHRRHHCRGW